MTEEIPYFSFYEAPISNTRPYKSITLIDVYKAITGTYFWEQTEKLRTIAEKSENRKYKATHFPYVTFSGTFYRRNEEGLTKHSGLIAIDFDHLEDVESCRSRLLCDPYFETELLFVSPNGNGLKWIIPIKITKEYPHGLMFQAIYNYVLSIYSIEIDKACRDVSRATFLCYDPNAFIHPKYLVK